MVAVAFICAPLPGRKLEPRLISPTAVNAISTLPLRGGGKRLRCVAGRAPSFDMYTTEHAIYAVFGGNDPIKALTMGAKILTAIRNSEQPVVLVEMQSGAGTTLVLAMVQGLVNYLEILRVEQVEDEKWRGVIARCAGEMLRILLLNPSNQVFAAHSKRLWRVISGILSNDLADVDIIASLWMSVSITAPFLSVSLEADGVVDLLKLASEYLMKSPTLAVQVVWFISGAIRGLATRISPGHNDLVRRLFLSLSQYVGSEDDPLRHATMTALLHLSRVYPEIGGTTTDLVFKLIQHLTEKTTGGLAASALYYISVANTSSLLGFENLLVEQTKIVSRKKGPQTDSMVDILGLLTNELAWL
jgi:hypothetical protein